MAGQTVGRAIQMYGEGVPGARRPIYGVGSCAERTDPLVSALMARADKVPLGEPED